MDSIEAGGLRVKWRIPLIVTLAGVLAVFALLMYSPDLGDIASLFLVVPVASLALIVFLIRGRGRTRLVCLALPCCYALLSWQMLKHTEEIRSEVRWLAGSRSWKAKVLQQPSRIDSGMKCAIWDGWGFAGSDTDVYLVFSPDDGLRNYSPTHLNGLPSPVWHVQRLERDWYSVTFYTDEGWDGLCPVRVKTPGSACYTFHRRRCADGHDFRPV